MPVTPDTWTTVHAPVGDVWLLGVRVTDADGVGVEQTPTVSVTKPDDTTAAPVMESLGGGCFRAEYTLAVAGRYVATATVAGYGVAQFAAFTDAVTPGSGMPTTAEVSAYLSQHSWSAPDLQDALDAEAAAQRRVCAVPAAYPPDLRNALLRRVARNLAMRPLPLAVLRGDAEIGDANLLPPGSDPEVRRLEKPHLHILIA